MKLQQWILANVTNKNGQAVSVLTSLTATQAQAAAKMRRLVPTEYQFAVEVFRGAIVERMPPQIANIEKNTNEFIRT